MSDARDRAFEAIRELCYACDLLDAARQVFWAGNPRLVTSEHIGVPVPMSYIRQVIAARDAMRLYTDIIVADSECAEAVALVRRIANGTAVSATEVSADWRAKATALLQSIDQAAELSRRAQGAGA